MDIKHFVLCVFSMHTVRHISFLGACALQEPVSRSVRRLRYSKQWRKINIALRTIVRNYQLRFVRRLVIHNTNKTDMREQTDT